jgi:hypothetical protein
LLRAQAVEFHSRLQAAYERLVQRTRTGILKLLQKYAKTERVALVSGKANNWALKHFMSDDLKGVDRFVVEPINPAMKTLAGKVSVAQPLLENGAIGLQEYLQLMSTGRLEPILRFSADNQARIQREKEMLMQGVGLPPVQMGPMGPVLDQSGLPMFQDDGKPHLRPLISDTHWVDIPEYLGVLAMPEVRDNPEVVQAVTEVVDFKMRLWRQMDPGLIMLLKGMMPPPMQPPGAPPMMGVAPFQMALASRRAFSRKFAAVCSCCSRSASRRASCRACSSADSGFAAMPPVIRSHASRNFRFSVCMTRKITSPPTLQFRQSQTFLLRLMAKRSVPPQTGHGPTSSLPARRNAQPSWLAHCSQVVEASALSRRAICSAVKLIPPAPAERDRAASGSACG